MRNSPIGGHEGTYWRTGALSVHQTNAQAAIRGNSCLKNGPPCVPARCTITTSAPAPRNACAHRARVMSVVDFLKDFDAQKNPPVTDITNYGLFTVRDDRLPAVPGLTLSGGGEQWLRVDFVDLPSAPVVPTDLVDYLLPEHQNLSPAIRPVPAVPERDLQPDRHAGSDAPGADPPAEAVADGVKPAELVLTGLGAERLAAARQWVDAVWEPWSTAYRNAQQAKDFYRQLFEQQQLITNDRETYEMVWGFSQLDWTTGDNNREATSERGDAVRIRHPLFTTVVEVTDGDNNALLVTPTQPLEVETLPFAAVALADRAALSEVRDAVNREPFDPWTGEQLVARSRTVVRALHHDGVVAGEGAARPAAPVVDTGWVLYTRRRRPDRQGFLDRMRELYETGAIPPDALSSLVVDTPSEFALEDDGGLSATCPAKSVCLVRRRPSRCCCRCRRTRNNNASCSWRGGRAASSCRGRPAPGSPTPSPT